LADTKVQSSNQLAAGLIAIRYPGATMRPRLSRRGWLGCALAAAVVPGTGAANEIESLDPASSDAKSLGFVSNASTVDVSANPTFRPDQRCGSCSLFQGKVSDKQAACAVFGGRQVPAVGWCTVWTARSG
jgi:hypothetical protein